jgi:tetratricopeptide (TPR) repeat protein
MPASRRHFRPLNGNVSTAVCVLRFNETAAPDRQPMTAALQLARPALTPEEATAVDKAMQTGLELHQRNLLSDAERLYGGVLKLVPHHFDALHLLGVARYQQGDAAAAMTLIDAALQVEPKSPEALNSRGRILIEIGRLDEALTSLNKALAVDPKHVRALINRAAVALRQRRFASALADAERVLRLDPNNAEGWSKRANALSWLGRRDEAETCYDRALAINPSLSEALNNRAGLLSETGRSDRALADLDAVLAANPRFAEAWMNRGNALMELQREEDAIASYRQAFALSQQPTARFLEGLGYLRLAQFSHGWQCYELRWHARDFRHSQRNYSSPRWDGKPLRGRLLVSGEQGLGEQIVFASMLPDLRAVVSSVTAEVERRLVPLFARSFPGAEVIALEDPLHHDPADAHIAMGSLGQHLRPNASAFPLRPEGYLQSDKARAADLRARLSDGRLLVGLSWHSRNPNYEATKSVRLQDFTTLLRLPGCRFVDLQYGDTTPDRAAIEHELGIKIDRLADIDNTNDLDGLAALICACDLVVTVSNTTAHLAGALGRETHVLVPFGRGRMWCWFTERSDSPWYPRARLWRQKPLQPWTEVIADVTGALVGRSASSQS